MNRDEIEAENAELRDMLVAAYRELQRHGVKSVPLSSESVHRDASPTDWRCRCVTQPQEYVEVTMPIYPKQAGDVPGWVQDEVNRATRQYRHNTDNSPNILSPEEGFVMAYDPQVIDALIRRLLAGGPLDPKEYTPVHNAVLRFLWGTAPYNGLWFHEAAARAHGSYWWRKYLPKPEE